MIEIFAPGQSKPSKVIYPPKHSGYCKNNYGCDISYGAIAFNPNESELFAGLKAWAPTACICAFEYNYITDKLESQMFYRAQSGLEGVPPMAADPSTLGSPW